VEKEDEEKVEDILIIEQTCHYLKIYAPSANEYYYLTSITATLHDDDVVFLYKAEYFRTQELKDFPESRFGYERLTRSRANNDVLQGKFYHCLSEDGKKCI
jgi:hypothetical protein